MSRAFADTQLKAAVIDTHVVISRVLDRCPNEVGIITSFVRERIAVGDNSDPTGQYIVAGLTKDFSDVHGAVLGDPECAAALSRLLGAYSELAIHPANRIRQKEGEHSIMAAVGLGLLLGSILVGAYCIYKANTE